MPVTFAAEPSNPHDPLAVMVLVAGRQIGYLYRGTLQRMYHDFCQPGCSVTGSVSLVSKQPNLITIDATFIRADRV